MKLFHVTNNPNMDNDPNKHYITIFMKVGKYKHINLFYSDYDACYVVEKALNYSFYLFSSD